MFLMVLCELLFFEGLLEFVWFFVIFIIFMWMVKKIEMFVDGISVLEVEKVVKWKERVERGGLYIMVVGGIMIVMNVDVIDMVIIVKIMKWFEGMYGYWIVDLLVYMK